MLLRRAEVQERSAIQVCQYLRDVCSWWLVHLDTQLLLRDPGVNVQINESLFRHKPKVSNSKPRRKCDVLLVCLFQYHQGRPTVQEVWMFGMVDTSQSPALGVMVTLPDRSPLALLTIMQRHLSIVWRRLPCNMHMGGMVVGTSQSPALGVIVILPDRSAQSSSNNYAATCLK